MPFSTYDVYIFTKDLSGNRLHEALIQTNRFDWSREVRFSGVDEYIKPVLLSVLDFLQTNRGIEINTVIPSYFYIKPANDCANMEIEVPEECYLGDLNLSHLATIHSLWVYADKEQPENSMKLLKPMITLNQSPGLFLKEGDVLISWVLHNEWHGLGVLQTLEPYKRRGFAKIVVKALAKRLGKEGISPIYYYWIENSVKWKKQDPDLALQIYCPQGKYQDDVTFVGISSVAIRNLRKWDSKWDLLERIAAGPSSYVTLCNAILTEIIGICALLKDYHRVGNYDLQITGLSVTDKYPLKPIMQSEIELSSDILEPIPLEEWPLLQELLKVEWPNYSHYYYWIENSIRWKKQDPDLAIEIYCPHGKYKEDVTFVAISSFSIWNAIFFTSEPSGKRLYNALLQTNRFDWSKEVIFRAINELVKPTFLAVTALLRAEQGIETNVIKPTYFYIRSANECVNLEITVPEGCYLGELNLSHLSIIHSFWPNADKELPENSMKLLKAMITFNKSVGLFFKEGNVLVSWALQDDWHGVGVVQTLESHKKKGYAKIVVNALARRIGEEGVSPILSVVCGNTPAENLFTSLNWKRTIPGTWVSMKKHPPSTD